jgi:hypothetical protein
MCLRDPFANAESQTVAAGFFGSGRINPKERFEDVRHVQFRKSLTIILNPDDHLALVFMRGQMNGATVRKGILEGILKQVAQHNPDLIAIDVSND